jgi:hypothetical protein
MNEHSRDIFLRRLFRFYSDAGLRPLTDLIPPARQFARGSGFISCERYSSIPDDLAHHKFIIRCYSGSVSRSLFRLNALNCREPFRPHFQRKKDATRWTLQRSERSGLVDKRIMKRRTVPCTRL